MIETRSLSVGWSKDRAVLKDVNLIFKPEFITTIAGPNGSGKSTLLKTLAGQLNPLSGQAMLDGSDISLISADIFARRVAYVPQSKEFSTPLSVRQIISLGRNAHQQWWSWQMSEEDESIVQYAIETAALTGFQDRLWSNLSGGEKQRTLIAVALAQQADFLLLDEPVSHLDFKYQLTVASLLKNLKESGKGIIVVLHDLNLIDLISDHLVLIKQESDAPSVVAAQGRPDQVLSEQTLAEVFGVKVKILEIEDDVRRSFLLKSI